MMENSLRLPTLKTERLYQKISSLLIEKIQSGQFPAGQSFPPERMLAKQLGISRASLREALIVLEVSGWVRICSGNGVFVSAEHPAPESPPSQDKPINDILLAYEMIEGEIVAQAAQHASEKQCAELRQVMRNIQQTGTDDPGLKALNQRCHLLLGEMTGNTVLRDLAAHLWTTGYSPLFSANTSIQSWGEITGKLLVDLERLIVMIINHDAAAARQTALPHLRQVSQ